jgi:hypothetical protein
VDEIIIERLVSDYFKKFYDEQNIQDKLLLSLYLMLSISYCF